MKRILTSLALALLVAGGALPAAARTDQAPEPSLPGDPAEPAMHMYQVVLAHRGPHWVGDQSLEGQDIRLQTIEAVSKANTDDLVAAYGMVDNASDVEFMIILNLPTSDQAREAIANIPAFKDGRFKPEVYSWYATALD